MKVSPSKLKVLLKNRGLTIKQFGKKLGMTRQGSYDLMKRVSVKEDMVDAICKVLQVDRDEFLESDKQDEYLMRPVIVCNDGFEMSVQGSKFHYCQPRALSESYSAMEIGYPSLEEPLLMQYAEDSTAPTNTVYGCVPTSVIQDVIVAHGGINEEKTFK